MIPRGGPVTPYNVVWLYSLLEISVEDLSVQLIKCYKGQPQPYINIQDKATSVIEVLQGARLSLNGFSYHQFSPDSFTFSTILRVSGIGRSMAKTIVTIAI